MSRRVRLVTIIGLGLCGFFPNAQSLALQESQPEAGDAPVLDPDPVAYTEKVLEQDPFMGELKVLEEHPYMGEIMGELVQFSFPVSRKFALLSFEVRVRKFFSTKSNKERVEERIYLRLGLGCYVCPNQLEPDCKPTKLVEIPEPEVKPLEMELNAKQFDAFVLAVDQLLKKQKQIWEESRTEKREADCLVLKWRGLTLKWNVDPNEETLTWRGMSEAYPVQIKKLHAKLEEMRKVFEEEQKSSRP